jgi:hypothetical protein
MAVWWRRAVPALVLATCGFTLAGCSSTRHKATGATATQGNSSIASSSAPTRSSGSEPSQTTKPNTHSAAPSGPSRSTASGSGTAAARASGRCELTSASNVASAFGGRIGRETAATSGIGNPLCQFELTGSNTGVPGKLSVTIDTSASPASFAKSKQQMAGAATVSGVGDAAFYLPGTATLYFLKGRNSGVIQADFRMPHGMPRNPSQVQADSIVLARVIAAHL